MFSSLTGILERLKHEGMVVDCWWECFYLVEREQENRGG